LADGSSIDDWTSCGGIDSWHTGAPHFEASVTRNVGYGNKKLAPEYSVLIPSRFLNLDPQGLRDVEVEFVAPRAGRYKFTGSFRGDDDGTGSRGYIPAHEVSVFVGDAEFYAGTIYRFQQSLGFDGAANLVAGEDVRFAVDTASDTNNLGTGLAAVVTSVDSTSVPEPSDWLLTGSGLAAAGGLLRRARWRTSAAV
jgi:hypothetical protein